MASLEIEPEDFIKGLRYLHSHSPDASDELKKLLDYYHSKKINYNQESRRSKDCIMNAFSSLQSLNQGIRNEEKRNKTIEDDSEATDIEDNEILDVNENSNNISISCAICKQGEVNANNRILECQACRLCYHPDCHKPPVPKKDINDPRSIWYCFKCKNTGKKPNKSISTVKVMMGKNNEVPLNKIGSSKGLESSETKSLGLMKRPKLMAGSSSLTSYSLMKSATSMTSNRATAGINASANNKNKTSNIALHSSSYASSNSISNLDKRLANIKKSKSNSKFS